MNDAAPKKRGKSRAFMIEIARKGGAATARKHPGHYQAIASMGARAGHRNAAKLRPPLVVERDVPSPVVPRIDETCRVLPTADEMLAALEGRP